MTETTVVPPSENTPRLSRRMQLVGEKQLPDPPPMRRSMQKMMTPATTSTEMEEAVPHPESTNQELVNRAAWRAGVIGAVNVVAKVLSARFVVLVAVLGGIGLTWTALEAPDPYRLAVLGVYALGVAVPTVWLASR